MLDKTSLIMRQDEQNKKLLLLKQIKIILESLMFSSQSFTGRSSWQNFSGTMTIFARHVLSVLEDGISNTDLNDNSSQLAYSNSSNTSLSCSPNDQRCKSSRSNSHTKSLNTLWLFVTTTLATNEITDLNIDPSSEEKLAKKNFSTFYNEIIDDSHHVERKLSILSSKSILSISDQCNLPLEWITYSLRQNVLLNQLVYLLRDHVQMRNYYRASAFVLDRSFTEDFLNYIRAYEFRDFKILSRVKRNFYEIDSPQNEVTQSGGLKSSPSASVNLPSNGRTESNLSVSPASSRNSSVTTSSFSSNLGKAAIIGCAEDCVGNTNTLVEHAVNEVNHLTLKRNAKSHRRMFSVPNVQINVVKRNNMTVDELMNESEQDESFSSNLSFNNGSNLNEEELKIEMMPSLLMKEPKTVKSDSLSSEFSVPTLNLNDQILNNELNEIFQCSPPSSPTRSTSPDTVSNDIYQQTSVFDFIHSQQINLECSQLDKENSHFIIADISIAASELIKTQELADSQPTTIDSGRIKDLLPKQAVIKARTVSNGIKIKHLRASNIRNFGSSPTDFNSPNTTRNLDDFAATSMACSMDHETIFASGFTSPNPEVQSISSVVATSKSEDTGVTPVRKLSNALSLVSLVPDDMEAKTYLQKSCSSSDLQRSSNLEESYKRETSDRLLNMRDMWLTAARKIVITQNLVKLRSGNINDTPVLCPISPTSDRDSIITEISETDADLSRRASNRTRRFSWEEIINLDTAEHISTRLIERLIDAKNTAIKTRDKSRKYKVDVPNLRQFEYFVKNLEYYEHMQLYFELRSNGLLQKYLADALKRASSKQNSLNNSFKFKSANTLSKVKTAAIAAATAVSINKEEFQLSQNFNNDHGKNTLIRRISVNINSIDNSGDEVLSPNSSAANLLRSNQLIGNSKRASVSSNSTLVGSNLHRTLNARIIGDENWAPVRDQLILNQAPKQKRLDQMIQQNFRCADCGIQVRRDKIKSFNYCEYFCKYFCRCCHINNQSYIPAYVINASDFRTKYEVSKKAKNFLEKIYSEPVITLESLNPVLFERSSVLSKIKKLRLRLYNCRVYINSCRFAVELKKQLFNQFDDFIINDQHVYSIETLFKIKKTNYYEDLKGAVNKIKEHIIDCALCSQQGYICGLCTNNELLYPFDLERVEKCSNCLACYHKTCLKRPEQCPRCRRKRSRIQSNTSGGVPSTSAM